MKMTNILKDYTNQHKNIGIGNRFLIEFGFIRGPVLKGKEKESIISSFDGYTFYLLIKDERSRYTWAFLTKDKITPIKIVDTFLDHRGLKEGMR